MCDSDISVFRGQCMYYKTRKFKLSFQENSKRISSLIQRVKEEGNQE